MAKTPQDTSWNAVAPWYNKLVGTDGHYYHQHVVLPGVVRLLELQSESKLLDIGCGQGILTQHIPPIQEYLGVDKAQALISAARKTNRLPFVHFETADATQRLTQAQPYYSHATIILALQNMSQPQSAIFNAANSLLPEGKLVIVLNHPCFRIPRQSGWGIDEQTKQQYRWENRYRSPLKIPITMHPGQTQSAVTWSFHRSLHDYSQMLLKAGFVITALEEWTSDKESVGKAAKMENRSRSEFPLFLTIVAQKKK